MIKRWALLLSIFAAAAATETGCSLEEIKPVGYECAPAVDAGATVYIGNVQCKRGEMAGTCITGAPGQEQCAPGCDDSCEWARRECLRYQNDWDALIAAGQAENSSKLATFLVKNGQESAISLNACPAKQNVCVWRKNAQGAIASFGCIECQDDMRVCADRCTTLSEYDEDCRCGGTCGENHRCNENTGACELDCKTNQFGSGDLCIDYSVSSCGLNPNGTLKDCTSKQGRVNISCDVRATPPQCVFDCDDANGFAKAEDGECYSLTYCAGINCNATVTGWADGACIEGKCVPSACQSNYTYDASASSCILCDGGRSVCDDACVDLMTSASYCGGCHISCFSDGARSADCIDGICITNDCKDDYFMENGQCYKRGVDQCGSLDAQCAAENAENACVRQETESGTAEWKCEFVCNAGYHRNAANDGCEIDSETSCGADLIDCTQIEGWGSGSCIDDACALESCRLPYYIKNDACILSDEENCGGANIVCSADGIENAQSASCGTGKCAIACISNYYYDEDARACLENDAENCGSKGYACLAHTPGALTAECSNGICKATECKTGYTLLGSHCAPPTPPAPPPTPPPAPPTCNDCGDGRCCYNTSDCTASEPTGVCKTTSS